MTARCLQMIVTTRSRHLDIKQYLFQVLKLHVYGYIAHLNHNKINQEVKMAAKERIQPRIRI